MDESKQKQIDNEKENQVREILNDEKVDKFRKLAKNRMPRVLKLMKLVENLANPYHYRYEKKQSQQIINDLRSALKDIEESFDKGHEKIRLNDKKSNNENDHYEYEI